MILFVIYAALAWFAAMRWRRTLAAFAAVLAAVGGLVLLAGFHLLLNQWTGGRIFLPGLQMMLYPYTVLVGLIGVYLACLPRSIPAASCRACEYDLRGLAADRAVCPECGRAPTDAQRALIADSSSTPPADRPALPEPVPTTPARRRIIRARLARARPRAASAPADPRSPTNAATPVFPAPANR